MELVTTTMTELLDSIYELRTPIIENLLYSGLYIFAGPPKVGKSFMVAQIGYCVSMGIPLWDMETSKGSEPNRTQYQSACQGSKCNIYPKSHSYRNKCRIWKI